MKTKIKLRKTAYEYCLYLLKFCNRSEVEIITRLKNKSYSLKNITQALSKLKKYKLVDEEAAIRQVLTSRIHKGFSNNAIRAELLHKGYPIDIIEKQIAVSIKETFSETARALNLAEHALSRFPECSDDKKRYKMQMLLYRKGFTYNTIEEVRSKLNI